MLTHAHKRRGLIGTLVAGLVVSPLALGFTAPAEADVSAKIAAFPYSQDWSDAGLITANDNWSGVPGVQGYLGAELTGGTGVDPQTLTADGSATTDVVANQAVTANNGGVLEVPGSIAIQGSGSAGAPNVVFHLDLSGQSGVTFAFNAKDLDASGDDAIQQIGVQYRVGATGAYTNLPAGYIADATTGGAATLVTAKSVPLPAATDGQADVFVRVLTTNAVGNDELVGIDDIAITAGGVVTPGPLAATNPGTKTVTVNQAITPFTLAATGGTPPVTWTSTTLPPGLTLAANGTVSGTPTATGTTSVTATATDSATPTPGTATTTFDIVVAAAQAVTPIAEIQGTGAASPIPAATPVTTEGVVTGVFSGSTATNGGIYIQTGGTGGATDATPGASDGLYVFGGNAQPAGVVVGDSVRVTGPVSEFGNLTQITPAAGGVVEIPALAAVTPAAIAYPAAAADREAHESELLAPTGAFTVSNVFNITGGANAFGEIGLASGTTPLRQPTDFVQGSDTAGVAAINAENAERAVALDDGSSINYMFSPNNALPLPWISGNTNPPRVGAPVTFSAPVVLDYRNSAWKFQPTVKITDSGAGTATFGTDRAQNAAPADVGGDLKIATFNVLNYFPTTGQAHVAAGGTCSYFNDRNGVPIADNSCNPDGPRGAATQESFLRQQEKIVDAINKLGASVVSLEELENSIKMIGQTDRDNAIRTLVAALNAAPGVGAGTWAFAPSPAAADLPTPAQEDVIRTGFIYKPAAVELVGPSVVLKDEVNFDNAREPLAQAFRPVGGDAASTFGVIVNHFKSKGSECDVNDPVQGNCNADRVGQAEALRDFAASFRTARGIDDLFLVGDFNSYTQEDPMQVLYAAGYDNIVSDDASDASYSFNGLAGSLDHVLGNAGAVASVTGSDIWEINANESLAYQYARYNYHGEIYHAVDPFSSSDHNPEVVGIDVADAEAPVDVQILATNDFHGRIANETGSSSAGAAVLAGAVKQFKAANPATSFVAAGDLIGASTFESFIAQDKPTIDALNEAGLDVSAVGNHEFDQGYDDLINRVIAPYDATTNPYGGAEWKYIGANVKFKASGDPALDPSLIIDQGGVQVGYVGAVTEHLDELVSPGGIADIEATDIVSAVNTEAAALKTEGADVVVLLVHEGATGTDCATITSDTTSDFGKITAGVSPDIDAIVSGHTHLVYNCSLPVSSWATEGRAVTERPVVSAGQYGSNLNKLNFSVDPSTGEVLSKAQAVLPLKAANGGPFNYPVDGPTQTIVDAAVANANVLGAEVIGQIAAPFNRAKLADGTTENRGGESTLGNLVAEIQRDQTSAANRGGAQIAFMNPGGLRADLAGTVNGASRDITFKQAANVQPFANTLVNEALTGAQIKAALEQQWQPASSSRPFLKLGISKGFSYTYDPAAAAGSRITAMYLNGTPIDLAATYSVTVNSFLATGGDNFAALNGAGRKQDTGVTDLQAQVDYFDAQTAPLAVDFSQRAVGVTNLSATPTAGQNVSFDLSSLSMTGPGDVVDTQVSVTLDGALLGTAPVTTTVTPATDEAGTASVMVPLPLSSSGAETLVVTGNNTGTVTTVPITVTAAPAPPTAVVTASISPLYVVVGRGRPTVTATVESTGSTQPTGQVEVRNGGRVLGTGTLSNGQVSIQLAALLTTGPRTLTVSYLGDDTTGAGSDTVTVQVVKQTPVMVLKAPGSVKRGASPTVSVAFNATGVPVTGQVRFRFLGKTVFRTIRNKSVSLKLPALTKQTNLYVVYLGSDKLNSVQRGRTIRIK